VPRIVLVDTFRDEAEETLRVAHALGDRLYGSASTRRPGAAASPPTSSTRSGRGSTTRAIST
jgi:hypothetical protein